MSNRLRFLLVFFFATIVACNVVHATHIRAAEIIARHLGDAEYEFKFIGYRDTGGDVLFGEGEIDFGDGSPLVKIDDLGDPVITNFNDKTDQWIYTFRHKYSTRTGFRTISFQEFFRNDEILNIEQGTPLYLETSFLVIGSVPNNQSPDLLIPPIDNGLVDIAFFHNPGAIDADGDRLVYKLVAPQRDKGLDVVSKTGEYVFPNDISLYNAVAWDNELKNGPATFSLDSITGDLVWDAPGLPGEYNIAIRVEEYRVVNGAEILIGFVIRDMQIDILEACENQPEFLRPDLELPKDTCIVAGSLLLAEIFGTDPSTSVVGTDVVYTDEVTIEGFGEPFNFLVSPATLMADISFIAVESSNVRAKSIFSWQTNCSHIRKSPYIVQFKVSDIPKSEDCEGRLPSLANFNTWRVTVVPPAPILETVEEQVGEQKSIELTWENYKESSAKICDDAASIRAESIQVWRRVDSYAFDPEGCDVGIPANSGYELVDEVPENSISYVDTNNGEGLVPGANYCYRLVAKVLSSNNELGDSYASNELCALVESEGPIITNVSVLETSDSLGKILVKWTKPTKSLVPSTDFKYNIYRSEAEEEPSEILATVDDINDTIYFDTLLNTMDLIYNYRIELVDSSNPEEVIDESGNASSVRLEASPDVKEIKIHWEADVPWSNSIQEYPRHLIYRDNVLSDDEVLVLYDSVDVTNNGFEYIDDGTVIGVPLSDQIEYCYFVTTKGSYGNERIEAPLLNNSQVICVSPNDTIPPCVPLELQVVNLSTEDCSIDCNTSIFSNTLTWEFNQMDTCGNDIKFFNIYFSSEFEGGEFEVAGTSEDTVFEHIGLPNSQAGCYKVSAVDRSGNESPLTEAICVDNCLEYELPNVFTPNNDELNPVFRPFGCPKFVRNVDLEVYNRYGKKVYTFSSGDPESSILINWDGRGDNGALVTNGVYYYVAYVTFDSLFPDLREQQFNGWVHVLY